MAILAFHLAFQGWDCLGFPAWAWAFPWAWAFLTLAWFDPAFLRRRTTLASEEASAASEEASAP